MWNFEYYNSKIAVIDSDGHSISYTELGLLGKRLYHAIGRRCLVFNMCDNVLGSLIGYTGFLNNGIVPIMLKQGLDNEMLRQLMNEYHPQYIWTSEKHTAIWSHLKTVYRSNEYVLLETEYNEPPKLNSELALLLTTSGSTGSPKFVRQSYKNIQCNTKSIVQYLHLDSNERPITTLPMNYTYGLSILNSHLYVGATILLTNQSLMQRDFWTFFKYNKATSIGGVPYTYEILKRIHFFKMDLPSLRTMTQAGGKISPELHKEYAEYAKEKQIDFIVMYGQCEATARMAYLPPQLSLTKIGSMGIPIPGGKFELIDENGKTIDQPGIVGELVYYGENVTLGYALCTEDLYKDDEWNGKLITGDMAKRDEEGFYFIVGRKKRFLKIFGNRVNLDETERLLKDHFPNIDLVCGGTDDHLYIFSKDEGLLASMKQFLSDKTGFHISAFKTIKLDEIPRNDAGKVIYRELEKFYG